MSFHLRQQIREAVTAALATGTMAGTAVFAMRRQAFEQRELPAVSVFTTDEQSEVENMGAVRHLGRELSIVVAGFVQDNDALQNTLDLFAAQIEKRLGAAVQNPASALRGVLRDLVLVRSEISYPAEQRAEKQTASVILTYRASYRTRIDDPTTTN